MLHSFPDGRGVPQLYSPAGLMRLALSRSHCAAPAEGEPFAGLVELCAAFETARPEQTTFGKINAQTILLDAIGKRLRLVDYLQRFPQIATEDLPAPIFIVAPFRTGTTFLHRLLSCDPASRWPRLWEVAYPPPAAPELRGDTRYFAEDARIAMAAAALRSLHRASPTLVRLHPMAPDLAEECFGLLETSFMSDSFMFYAELDSYCAWLDQRDAADWRAAYRIYAQQLRLLQWWYPGRRWVLKSPVHLRNIDALLHTFPHAHIVFLHRSPADATASFCRLLSAYRQLMCKAAKPGRVAEQARSYADKAQQRAYAARRATHPSRFIDLDFATLVAEPIACVKAIYAHVGIELEPIAAAAMRAWLCTQAEGTAGQRT